MTADSLKNSRERNTQHAGIGIGTSLQRRVADLYHSGLTETDALKKFLFLFSTVEIFTHLTFKRLNHAGGIRSISAVPARIKEAGQDFLASQQDELKGITARFTWCAIVTWPNLGDSDVLTFTKVLRLRDDLAHGRSVDIPSAAVQEIELLTTRLLVGSR